MNSSSWTRVEIDLAALRHNYQVLKMVTGTVKVMAVVKADAYGHGMLKVAEELSALGVDALGVAEVREGVALRRAGITAEIVVLLGLRGEEMTDVVEHGLSPVVFEPDLIAELSVLAVSRKRKVDVHLKVDTGMGRLGISPEEVEPFLQKMKSMAGIRLAGIMSHFPMADVNPGATQAQNRVFAEISGRVATDPGHCVDHIANSSALLLFPEMHCSMVRPGISLYGCYPSAGMTDSVLIHLEPVMSFKTRVIQVKEVRAGQGISYGHTFVTERSSRLAVLPVGYQNGYLRSLSNRAQVLIHGRRVPVVGRVCMNITMVDVTDIGDVSSGDEVVLMGVQADEKISTDELADWMGTINYEVLCLFGNNNLRRYI